MQRPDEAKGDKLFRERDRVTDLGSSERTRTRGVRDMFIGKGSIADVASGSHE
jgi:hypothetical protein